MTIYFEETQSDNKIIFNWFTLCGQKWKRILHLIKLRIPSNHRIYNPDDKSWSIDKTYQAALDNIKNEVEHDESLETEFFDAFRNLMLIQYRFKCYTCGIRPNKVHKLHMHRVLAGRLGGEYVDDNVVILCNKCHKKYEGQSWEFFHDTHNKNEANNE